MVDLREKLMVVVESGALCRVDAFIEVRGRAKNNSPELFHEGYRAALSDR